MLRTGLLALAVTAAAFGCRREPDAVVPVGGHVPPAPLRVHLSKDQELAALPVGIQVTHTPNPVKAQAGGRSGQHYTWLYETRVAAISEDVTITEFGALLQKGPLGSWQLRTIYDRPFDSAEFAGWYSCPGAVVHVGTACVDPSNYTGGDQLREQQTRWYFIGRTRSGQLVKGEAIESGTR
jgi:hypothetical protein